MRIFIYRHPKTEAIELLKPMERELSDLAIGELLEVNLAPALQVEQPPTPVESTTFAPPFVRPEPTRDVPASIQKPSTFPFPCLGFHFPSMTWGEYDERGQLVRTHKMAPNANLPSSLAALQNCGKDPKPHIEAEPTPQGLDYLDNTAFEAEAKRLSSHPYVRFLLDKIERLEQPSTPQGLPSAEELAKIAVAAGREFDGTYTEWDEYTAHEQEAMIASVKAVRDAVLQAVATKYSLDMAKEDIVIHNAELLQQNKALEAKVRELEGKLSTVQNGYNSAERMMHEWHDLADKHQAQLAALGTPIDPTTLKGGDAVRMAIDVEVEEVFPNTHPNVMTSQSTITVEEKDNPTYYALRNAPTE